MNNKGDPQEEDNLLLATTPEGKAFRENGLRNMEEALREKTYENEAERAQILAMFQELANLLRTLDVQIPDQKESSE